MKKSKRIHLDSRWFDADPHTDDSTLLALLKYVLRGDIPDDEALLDRISSSIDRIDSDRRKREAARIRRAERTRAAKEARLQAQAQLEVEHHPGIAPQARHESTEAADIDTTDFAACARIFSTFAPHIRHAVALRETAKVEASLYPGFEQFIKTYSPSSHFNVEANWTRFRHTFPTTWPEILLHLPTHLANIPIHTRPHTPAQFFLQLKQTTPSGWKAYHNKNFSQILTCRDARPVRPDSDEVHQQSNYR